MAESVKLRVVLMYSHTLTVYPQKQPVDRLDSIVTPIVCSRTNSLCDRTVPGMLWLTVVAVNTRGSFPAAGLALRRCRDAYGGRVGESQSSVLNVLAHVHCLP